MLKITVMHLPPFLFCCSSHSWHFTVSLNVSQFPMDIPFSDAYGLFSCSSCCMEESWKAARDRVKYVTSAQK